MQISYQILRVYENMSVSLCPPCVSLCSSVSPCSCRMLQGSPAPLHLPRACQGRRGKQRWVIAQTGDQRHLPHALTHVHWTLLKLLTLYNQTHADAARCTLHAQCCTHAFLLFVCFYFYITPFPFNITLLYYGLITRFLH